MDTNVIEIDHRRKVRQFFGEPDRYLGGDARLAVRRMLVTRIVEGIDRSRILDIGCGDGTMSLPVLEPGGHLTLLDFSPPMLERAAANIPETLKESVDVVCGDMMQFVPEDRYSLVLCLGVLAHVPDVTTALARIASFLQPGGHCLFQITDTARWLGRINHAWFDRRNRARSNGYSLNRLHSGKLVAGAESVGLRLVECRGYRLALPGLGRLPGRWLFGLERKFLDSRLSRHGAETLMLFSARATH